MALLGGGQCVTGPPFPVPGLRTGPLQVADDAALIRGGPQAARRTERAGPGRQPGARPPMGSGTDNPAATLLWGGLRSGHRP